MYIYSICIYIVILYSIFKGMYHPFLEFYRCHKFSWQKQKQFKACVTLAWKTTSFLGETFSYPKLPCLESIEQNWMNCIYLSLPQWESGVCNCKARTFNQQNYLSESKRMEFHLQESIIHPGRFTWIIMEVWKIIFLSKRVICRFHANLPGYN